MKSCPASRHSTASTLQSSSQGLAWDFFSSHFFPLEPGIHLLPSHSSSQRRQLTCDTPHPGTLLSNTPSFAERANHQEVGNASRVSSQFPQTDEHPCAPQKSATGEGEKWADWKSCHSCRWRRGESHPSITNGTVAQAKAAAVSLYPCHPIGVSACASLGNTLKQHLIPPQSALHTFLT